MREFQECWSGYKSKIFKNMKLSICIPTYNRKDKVLRQLTKVVSQLSGYNSDEIEVIVSDNCSTDGTSDALSKMKNEYGIKIVTQTSNLGLVGNLYFLFEYATGEYIWFLSDDDVVDENAVANLMTSISKTHKDFYLLNFSLDNNMSSLYWNKTNDYFSLFKLKTWGGFGLLSAQVLRKEIFRDFYYSTKSKFNLCQPVAVSLYGLFYLDGEILFDRTHLTHHVGDYSWASKATEVSSVYLYYSIGLLRNYGDPNLYKKILKKAISENIMAGSSMRYIIRSRDFRFARDLFCDGILFYMIKLCLNNYIKRKCHIC